MKYLVALILLAFSLACFAAVYMQTDSAGNVIYSDTPEEHSKAITIPSDNNEISLPQTTAPALASPGLATAAAEATTEENSTKGYTTFSMISPIDQQTFQNERDIPVTIDVKPSLKKGDQVQLYVDGNPSSPPSADLTQLAIHQVDRGEHQLSAALVDSSGQVLMKTANITIFIHYSALVTGQGGISPTSTGGNGVTPSSPGTGTTPPSYLGSGVTPPASSGSGVVPPTGNGVTPTPSGGSGIIPPVTSGSGIVPGR